MEWADYKAKVKEALEKSKFDVAEATLLQALQWLKDTGGSNERLCLCLDQLAWIYVNIRDLDRAATCYKESLDIKTQILGNQNPIVARACKKLATVVYMQKRFDLAEKYSKEALNIFKATLGLEHEETQQTLSDLVSLLRKMNRNIEANILQNIGRQAPTPAIEAAVEQVQRGYSTSQTFLRIKVCSNCGLPFDGEFCMRCTEGRISAQKAPPPLTPLPEQQQQSAPLSDQNTRQGHPQNQMPLQNQPLSQEMGQPQPFQPQFQDSAPQQNQSSSQPQPQDSIPPQFQSFNRESGQQQPVQPLPQDSIPPQNHSINDQSTQKQPYQNLDQLPQSFNESQNSQQNADQPTSSQPFGNSQPADYPGQPPFQPALDQNAQSLHAVPPPVQNPLPNLQQNQGQLQQPVPGRSMDSAHNLGTTGGFQIPNASSFAEMGASQHFPDARNLETTGGFQQVPDAQGPNSNSGGFSKQPFATEDYQMDTGNFQQGTVNQAVSGSWNANDNPSGLQQSPNNDGKNPDLPNEQQ